MVLTKSEARHKLYEILSVFNNDKGYLEHEILLAIANIMQIIDKGIEKE